MSSFIFLAGYLSPRGFFQSTVQPQQSAEMTFERVASLIKVKTHSYLSGCCHGKM